MFKLVLSNPQKQMKNGFEKCRGMHPKVSITGAIGNYHVIGNENKYNVKLFKNERGQKIAECCCKANENGMFCYHIAAAVLAHTGIMRQRYPGRERARATEPRPNAQSKGKPRADATEKHLL